MGFISKLRNQWRSVSAMYGGKPHSDQTAPSRGAGGQVDVVREQFREMLIGALDDPAVARHVASRLLLPAFPVRGAACSATAAAIGSGDFGSLCDPADTGNYTFTDGGKVGIGPGAGSPSYRLDVSDASTQTARFKNPSTDTGASTKVDVRNDADNGFRNLVYGSNYSYGSVFDVGPNGSALTAIGGPLGVGTGVNNTNPLYLGVNASTKVAILNSGNVGIGTTNPQAKLHVKGGGVTIEDDMGAGRLGFAQTDESDARTVLYRGGTPCGVDNSGTPDITILRNFPQAADPCVVWTLLRIWAPRILSGTPDREATISLVRDLNSTDDDSQEFIDLYNNGYASETQHGIRIQKRTGNTTAQYRDFVFDQYDGNEDKTTYQMMMLATDRTVHMRSHGDSTNWPGSDSIHATASVTTTDATQATLFPIPLENGRAYFVTARVVGRQSDGGRRAFYFRGACAFRETGPGSVLQGVSSIVTIESDTNLDCTVDVDSASNTARVRVTGIASETIYWVGTIEYQSVSTSS
jgi:hypothetical protein